MDGKPPGVWSLVFVPALLTLVVTVLRLVGQVQGWSPTVFGRPEAGGGGALLGISWLIFVFGLWFGVRVQRSGAGPASPGRALVTSLVALAVVFGGIALCQALDLVWFPDAENPGEPRGIGWMLGLMLLGVAIAFVANRRVALALLVYAFLARIPVVVVTWIALEQGWDTHYTEIAEGFPEPAEGERLVFLATPQVTFWPLITVLLGTATGCLGGLLAGRRTG